jgi:uncharacterized membrane protein YjgN (DUF898 family)
MKRYQLVCKTTFGKILMQLIVWALLSLITFGLATPFFIYYMVKMLINQTELHEIEETQVYPPNSEPW